METDSILIKESVNAYKMSDRVSQNVLERKSWSLRGLREFIEVYIDNEVYSLSYNRLELLPPDVSK